MVRKDLKLPSNFRPIYLEEKKAFYEEINIIVSIDIEEPIEFEFHGNRNYGKGLFWCKNLILILNIIYADKYIVSEVRLFKSLNKIEFLDDEVYVLPYSNVNSIGEICYDPESRQLLNTKFPTIEKAILNAYNVFWITSFLVDDLSASHILSANRNYSYRFPKEVREVFNFYESFESPNHKVVVMISDMIKNGASPEDIDIFLDKLKMSQFTLRSLV